jgi:glucose/arabinose dehydrogenase
MITRRIFFSLLGLISLLSCMPKTAVQSSATPASNNAPASISRTTIANGLETPWAIAFAPDGRLFISERPGRIRIIKGNALQSDPWMKLNVTEVSESGLLGLATDPNFRENKYIYAAYSYSENNNIKNRLVRLKEEGNHGVTDKILIDNVPGGYNHDGGRVKFGPDGKLYWSLGETFQRELAQDKTSLNGKILRINPDGSIPADNPFPGSYIYSYGHRNVQGLAWQPSTGLLFATEHGPSGEKGCCRDELNLVEAGKNYGWPEITGDETKVGMVSPILQSGADKTWAPAGATFVTRGPWAGSLLFTGLKGNALYRVILDPKEKGKVAKFESYFEGELGRLRDIEEGPDGALYLLTSNRDGRGSPSADDDKVIKLEIK